MKNKKLLYILAFSIEFSSNNALSMSWLSEKFSGFTAQAQNTLGYMVNTMSEWSDRKTLTIVGAGIILLAGYWGKDSVRKWFDNFMNKIPEDQSKKEVKEHLLSQQEENLSPVVSILRQNNYSPNIIKTVREQNPLGPIAVIIDKELIRYYENKISKALEPISPDKKDNEKSFRELWIEKADRILQGLPENEEKEGNLDARPLMKTLNGSELGLQGTKYQALMNVKKRMNDEKMPQIPFITGAIIKSPKTILLLED